MQLSMSEIINKACELKTKQEKIEWLQSHNSTPLRNILICTYDKSKVEFLIPPSDPPYQPTQIVGMEAALKREARKLKYFIKGMGFDDMNQIKRESVFIELLETVDPADAKLLLNMVKQKSLKGLTPKTINDAFGEIISTQDKSKKDGKE